MKTPPFLLAAALLFWGWQAGFLIAGAIMAVVLESSRFIKARWDLSDDDFARIWTFCTLLFLAAFVFAFANNAGPASFGKLFENPGFTAERVAGNTSALTAVALIRWLPMIFFLFIAAQLFSPREGIPLETISLILWRRRKKARKAGRSLPPTRNVNVSYPYLVTCLFAASGHASEDNTFFWGLSALLARALWLQRSRRFGLIVWASTLGIAILLGYFGQRGIGRLARLAEEYNPQWLAHFIRERTDPKESRTEIGHIGRMKLSGKIVIRLEPKNGATVPTYLREASYRIYESQIWHAGSSKNDFTGVPETPPNSGEWPLLPGTTNPAAVNIACYLNGINAQDRNPEGLLPLPPDCGRLENLPAYVLQKNSAGAVLADGPGLVIFDACYGSGSTIDSPPGTGIAFVTNEDLAVSAREKPALDEVISGLNVTGKSDEAKLLAVSGFFSRNFKYSLWQDIPRAVGANETPLRRFLLHTRSGHCEYFATATVLLLRELHIPARYAVGYVVHEASGHKYVVRLRDAHAWCLVWNQKAGVWQNFDTTPGSWVAEEEQHASPLQFLSDSWSWIQFQFARFRWGQSQVQRYILWALVPALGLLLYLIIFHSSRRRHRRKAEEPLDPGNWPGLDSEFYRLEQKLVKRGLTRRPSEPLSVWLQRVADDPDLAGLEQPLHGLLLLHYRYRFDPQGLNQAERKALRQEVETCLAGRKW
jgi:protein-glutamine gamma-glutamyltransferase